MAVVNFQLRRVASKALAVQATCGCVFGKHTSRCDDAILSLALVRESLMISSGKIETEESEVEKEAEAEG